MNTKLIIFAVAAMAMSANGCSNDIPDRVCDKFLEDGKCNFGFAKEKCAKTCDACKFFENQNKKHDCRFR